MSSVYDNLDVWVFYVQLLVFIVFFLFVIKFFINIFEEHKTNKQNEKII
jgi:F0F1-type ATP synthase membrane subunit b/b'